MSLFFALKLNVGHAHPATVQHAHDTNAEGPRFDPLQKKQKVPFFYPWNRKPLGIGRLKPFLQIDQTVRYRFPKVPDWIRRGGLGDQIDPRLRLRLLLGGLERTAECSRGPLINIFSWTKGHTLDRGPLDAYDHL